MSDDAISVSKRRIRAVLLRWVPSRFVALVIRELEEVPDEPRGPIPIDAHEMAAEVLRDVG